MATTRATRVYDVLRSEILSGHRLPGERITEVGLAAEFKTSQGPIREAFARLRQEGLIVCLPHRGTFVSTLSLEEARHVYEVRRRVEPYAASLACARLEDIDIAALESDVRLMLACAGREDFPGVIKADVRFHGRLVRLAGSPFLANLWTIIEGQTQQFLHVVGQHYFGTARQTAESHRPLMDRIAARDADGLQAELVEHISYIWAEIDRAAEARPATPVAALFQPSQAAE